MTEPSFQASCPNKSHYEEFFSIFSLQGFVGWVKEDAYCKVFETSFDWKHCHSNTFIEQKLHYIHQNPCKGKWNLAASPIEYIHSSARYYLTGEQGLYEVLHYRFLEEVDLNNEQ